MRGGTPLLVGVKSWREKGRQEVYLVAGVEGRPGGHRGARLMGLVCSGLENHFLTVVACEIISSQFVLLVFHHC